MSFPKHKLIFDFDQTLAYRDGMWTATIVELIRENGYLQISENDIRKHVQGGGFPWDYYETPHQILFNNLTWWEFNEKFIERILIKNRIPRDEAKRISKLVRERYLNIKRWRLFDDTSALLSEFCNLGYECYILSNHTPELETLVSGLGIDSFITKVYNSAKIGFEKPNSKCFQYMLNDIKAHPSNAIMIGDNYFSDITGAKNIGMKAIYVRSKNDYNYTYYSSDLSGIVPIVKTMESKNAKP